MKSIDREFKVKKSIYYEHLLEAWLATQLEYDKSLLFISMGAIGLLITLLTTMKFVSSCYIMLLFVAILSFLVAGVCAAFTFWVNADYVRFVLVSLDDRAYSKRNIIAILRIITRVGIIIGIILALVVSVILVYHRT